MSNVDSETSNVDSDKTSSLDSDKTNLDSDKIILTELFILLGIPLLIQYFFHIKNSDSTEIENLWSNNNKNIIKTNKTKIPYIISIIISAICALYIYGYFMSNNNNKDGNNTIIAGFILLLGFSLLWLPYHFFQKDTNKYTAIVLLMVAFGSLLILIGCSVNIANNGFINNDNSNDGNKEKDGMLIFSIVYLFFHTFFLDFLIWNGHVFSNK